MSAHRFPWHVQGLVWLLLPYFRWWKPCRVEGLERLPEASQGCLYLCNHISIWETLRVPWAVMQHHGCYSIRPAAKVELMELPVIGRFLRTAGVIAVRRGRAAGAYRSIRDALGRGVSVLLFPEGTRSRTGEVLPFNRGLGKLVLDTRAPVIPVWIEGFERWRWYRPGQPARIVFGPMVPFEQLAQIENADSGKPGEAISREIRERILELGRTSSDGYCGESHPFNT